MCSPGGALAFPAASSGRGGRLPGRVRGVYGATRFDEFTARPGLTDRSTAARLRDLERAGVLDRRAYREPGQRQRHEYVLTEAGGDLMPAVMALLQWANRHDPPPYPPEVRHDGCGEPVRIVPQCDAGHRVDADDLVVSASGPFGLRSPVTLESWEAEPPSSGNGHPDR
jgi:DNA-binding HxlR family transcriptional regulator